MYYLNKDMVFAHEVKNILALVLANINIMEINEKNEDHLKRYSSIKKDLSNINELIMDFIKCDESTQRGRMRINLLNIIKEIVSRFHEALNHSFDFEYDFPVEEIYIYGNQIKIRELFINIIKNAIEAESHKRRLHLRISAAIQNEYIKIVIADNGKGLDAGELKRIRNPYYTTKQGGNGVGLSIVTNIVSSYKGFLDIQSEVDKGSSVTILFPLKKGASSEILCKHFV